MKKIFALCILSLFLFTSIVMGGETNLDGCWDVDISSITSDGVKGFEHNVIKIMQDPGDNRFHGFVSNLPEIEEGRNFSGVVNGKELYITHWDSLSKATLRGKKDEFSGINQALDSDNRASQTSTAIVIKFDDNSCCNGYKDQDETDIDCGGPVCGSCSYGMLCNVNADCMSGDCNVTCQEQP